MEITDSINIFESEKVEKLTEKSIYHVMDTVIDKTNKFFLLNTFFI